MNCRQKSRFCHLQLGAPTPTLLGTLWAPFWLLIGSQDGPKSLQDDPKMAPRRRTTPPSQLLELSRTPATAPRSPPELPSGLQEPPGTLQGLILTSPGAVWGSILTPPRGQETSKKRIQAMIPAKRLHLPLHSTSAGSAGARVSVYNYNPLKTPFKSHAV